MDATNHLLSIRTLHGHSFQEKRTLEKKGNMTIRTKRTLHLWEPSNLLSSDPKHKMIEKNRNRPSEKSYGDKGRKYLE